MNNKELAKAIREYGYDSVGRNKNGEVVVRLGFFYRHGCSAEAFAEGALGKLAAQGIAVRVVDKGEIYKAFRGGASVANQSHWWVTLTAEE